MKKHIQILLLVFCARSMLAQQIHIPVPNNLGNTEGNSSMSDFLNSSSFRMQMVFDASQFASLSSAPGVSNSVNSISLRLDGASTRDVVYLFNGGSVTLSTTAKQPDGLSPTFADNVGANAVTVYNGALEFGAAYQAGKNPQPFAADILLTSPFFYSPAQGNLLVDIRGVSGQSLGAGALDAESSQGDSVSRVFALSNLADTGTADTLGLVARFDITVVPEPSYWALIGAGTMLVAIYKVRFKRR